MSTGIRRSLPHPSRVPADRYVLLAAEADARIFTVPAQRP
jgi:hypothetical protein